MRTVASVSFVSAILLASLGCDKEERSKELVSSVVGDSAAPSAAPATPRDAAAAPTSSGPKIERPIPKAETTVSASAPVDVQMKTIQYMAAMKAPREGDANVDEAYVADLVTKLKPVVLAMDRGPDKAKWNKVEIVAKGRQIDMFMSDGCDSKAPFNALVQRANVPLATLLSHGVLCLRCNDTRHQCLQSTRDQEDVICTTAPRHK